MSFNLKDHLDSITTDWKPYIEKYMTNEIISEINCEIKNGHTIYPTDIFNAFKYFNLKETVLVILGQDPYHNTYKNIPYACGLSFSYTSGIDKAKYSLGNIFKELNNEYGILRTNTNLESWAKQGVLLLNTSLTVRKGKAGSHKFWTTFTDNIIHTLSKEMGNKITYLLLGAKAQEKEKIISQFNCKIVKAGHPSPMNRSNNFIGSNCFKKANADNKINYFI